MIRATAIMILAAGAAFAEAPNTSLVPPARPAGQGPTPTTQATPAQQQAINDPVAQFLNNIFKPQPRPRAPQNTQVRQQTAAAGSNAGSTVARSPNPPSRPQNLQRQNTVNRTGFALFGNQARRETSKGSVCGVNAIKGVKVQDIPGRIKGCGVSDPVKVTQVGGLALSTPATIDCPTAIALNSWVENSVRPNVGRLGGGPVGLHVMASYACRTRNNQKGGRISEHGRGKAVDIGGIILKNGVTLSVLDHWRSEHGPVMKTLHAQACGPFGTVLGPNSDRFHQNHFHFDTASYRSGPYCR